MLADALDEHVASLGTSMRILTGSDADAARLRHGGEDGDEPGPRDSVADAGGWRRCWSDEFRPYLLS